MPKTLLATLLSLPLLVACASAPPPKPDPAAEAERQRVERQKRLVVLLRAGALDGDGPTKQEVMKIISALSGVDSKLDPTGFEAIAQPTMLEAAKAHDHLLYVAMLDYQCRARQTEAQRALKALHRAEEEFREEHERYGTLAEVGFRLEGARYEVDFESLNDLGYVARARGRGEMDGDLWRVSHGHEEPEALVDVCTAPGR